jgi:signal transduction histidine kinase
MRAVCENALAALAPGGRIEITCALRHFLAPVEPLAARHGSEPSSLAGEGRVRGQPASNGRAPVHAAASAKMQKPQHLAITIRDNGPGMPAEVRRHAFDPFYSGRGAGRGLGNGLSKCWRIVTAHGGRVEIDSTSQGTCVTMLLPVFTGVTIQSV